MTKKDKRKQIIYWIICLSSVALMFIALFTEKYWSSLEYSHPFIFGLMLFYAFPLGGLYMWIMVFSMCSANEIDKKYSKLEKEKQNEEKQRKIIRQELKLITQNQQS